MTASLSEASATTEQPSDVGLAATSLHLGYGGATVCEDLTLRVPSGGFTVIVGPNACGKSTLLKAFARLLVPSAGQVTLDGVPLRRWKPRDFARRVGLLPQSATAPDGIRVADLVRRGRSPHQTVLSRWSREDEDATANALRITSIEDLAGDLLHRLSGGQRQRVWIAMLLAQQTDILLLDEPTTFLDITHQYGVLDLAQSVRETSGRTVVAVLHDLNQACRYATTLVVMKNGRIVATGDPREVMTAELVSEVYEMPCRLLDDPESGAPLVVPKTRPTR